MSAPLAKHLRRGEKEWEAISDRVTENRVFSGKVIPETDHTRTRRDAGEMARLINLAIPHVNGTPSVGCGFLIVGDHENCLSEALI